MKKTWETPSIMVQQFEANEYVAACITGMIQCVYPGTAKAKGDNGVYDDYNNKKSGWYTDSYGMTHGICGNNATISFNGETASGFEVVNGRTDTSRPIYSIKGYGESTGIYDVTWTSKDTNEGSEYHHKGRLIVKNIDDSHPNHS